MSELVTLEDHEAACVVRLQRPTKPNAISEQVERGLCDALQTPEGHPAPGVIFSGGRAGVSAGADVAKPRRYPPEEIHASYRASGDFAERPADFRIPEVALGLLPSWAGTQRVRLLGAQRAKELILLHEPAQTGEAAPELTAPWTR